MRKALYRKYRPTSLDTVIGQEHITRTLKNALNKGMINHAYLFTGLRGSGKTSVARILAHKINNLEYNEENNHLDIIEIDAASNRRIDEIRELRDKVFIAPTSSKYKIYIIDEVHMLTREAFNALLKTLEEPPEHVIFILATTEAHKVPETIISRTQRYTFKPIPDEKISEQLRYIADQENLKITDHAIKKLSIHSKGSLRDGISMLDQIAGFGHQKITEREVSELLGIPDSKLLDKLLLNISNSDSLELFETTKLLRDNGASVAVLAKTLISELRQQIMDKNTIISPARTVRLMRKLLAISGASGSYEELEIILLDCMELSEDQELHKEEPLLTTTTKEPADLQKDPSLIDTAKINIPKETDIRKDTKTNITAQNNTEISTTTDAWKEVLKTIKTNYNTLYSILRMAKIELKDDEIIIKFHFAFHKKQLDQTKNITYLKKVISEKFVKPLKISILSDKTSKLPEKTYNKKPSDTLSNVSNIFGGAELLES